MSEQSRLATRAVGKLFVVPAGALPVSVSETPIKSLKSPNLRPKQFYCRPRPAAQLLPISPGSHPAEGLLAHYPQPSRAGEAGGEGRRTSFSTETSVVSGDSTEQLHGVVSGTERDSPVAVSVHWPPPSTR
jgi:hypothetical protein